MNTKRLSCAICGDNNYKLLYKENFDINLVNENTFSARRVPEKCHYELVKCKKCGLTYSQSILEEEKIKALYTKSKLIYGLEINNLKDSYGRYLSMAADMLEGRDTFLEIGCGNGFMLEKALEIGFKDVHGVEPSRQAVEMASDKIKNNIIVDFFKGGLYKDNCFDLISFFHTLDHIIDPNDFLINCYRILKKGGIVLCIAHNTSAFSTKILGERSPIYDIEHVYLFNKSTLKKIFEKNNFEAVKIIDILNKYSIDYWTQALPVPHPLKNAIRRLCLILKIRTLTLSVGNIGIIAKKPAV